MSDIHIVLKYNDNLYRVDTIKEHEDVIKDKGKVIWGIIKPSDGSPGVDRGKIKLINEQIKKGIETKAFFYTQGRITAVGLITKMIDREEMKNSIYLDLIPEYYRKDINRCVAGVELSSMIKLEDDTFERANLYRFGTEFGSVSYANRVNPMYVSERTPRSYFFKNYEKNIVNLEVINKEVAYDKVNTNEIVYNVKDELDYIKSYIKNHGFSYNDKLIENFYLSLKSKPFLILAGISGTGKSKLARLFAEAIGCNTKNGRFMLVPVRPDWSDSTELLGYKDMHNKFHPGVLTNFIKRAINDINRPYFFVLDEMNLARVEHYFSDILSIIESRKKGWR